MSLCDYIVTFFRYNHYCDYEQVLLGGYRGSVDSCSLNDSCIRMEFKMYSGECLRPR